MMKKPYPLIYTLILLGLLLALGIGWAVSRHIDQNIPQPTAQVTPTDQNNSQPPVEVTPYELISMAQNLASRGMSFTPLDPINTRPNPTITKDQAVLVSLHELPGLNHAIHYSARLGELTSTTPPASGQGRLVWLFTFHVREEISSGPPGSTHRIAEEFTIVIIDATSGQSVISLPIVEVATVPPVPSKTPTPQPSPTTSNFPVPTPIPIAAFSPPLVETMDVRKLDPGAWTTFIPPSWLEKLRQKKDIPHVSAITVALDGSVWFGTEGGVASTGVGAYHYDGITWTHFTRENGLPFDEVSALATAVDGAIWFGSYCCGVARFDGKTWTTFTTENGLADNDIRAMAATPNGDLWFGTSGRGITRYDGKSWQSNPAPAGHLSNYIDYITVIPDGTIWASYDTHLIRFLGQSWEEYPTPWMGNAYTSQVTQDAHGNLWIGSQTSGAYRRSGNNQWTHFTKNEGLASDWVVSIAATRDGSVWFSTTQGVSRFDGKTWTTFKLESAVGQYWSIPIVEGKDGSIWLGFAWGMAHSVIPPVSRDLIQPTPTQSVKTWSEKFLVIEEVGSASALSTDDSVKSLFENWLVQYQGMDVPEDARLESFQINEVSVYSVDVNNLAKNHQMDFVARVIYSVKPQQNFSGSRWCAGDGFPADDGWINKKVEWVVGKKLGTQSMLMILGPCPSC
jgi:hypothetical protein